MKKNEGTAEFNSLPLKGSIIHLIFPMKRKIEFMKNVIFIVLVSSSLLIAQSATIDSCATVIAQDTVCISDLVQQQINKAIEKQSQQIVHAVSEAKINFCSESCCSPQPQMIQFAILLMLYRFIFKFL